MEGEQPRCAIGVLTKWVNYGKGWRKRVVCLEPGGVLTYFTLNKVNLPLLAEAHHGCVDWIGSEVSTLLGSQKARYVQNEVLRHEAQGTVSLSVASVRKSRNESKKFYVDTGTSVLQFYAQGADERQAWLAVLDGRSGNPPLRTARSRAVAQMFSRLRSQGAMSADACEEVSSHIRALQARLRTERRERKSLLTWLYTLQEEKRALEEELIHSTLDSECIREALTEEELAELIQRLRQIDFGGEEDDEDLEDVEDEEEEEVFYDAEEAQHAERRRTLVPPPPGAAPDALAYMASLPAPERRRTLPIPREPPRRLSLWGLLKEAVGKDLSRIALPVYFNEPISGIQKGCEDLEYSELLDAAAACAPGSVERMANVAAFCVSGYASTHGRTSKPFNPLLAETYEIHDVEKGLRFVGEKVCHHPTILAGFAEGRAWSIRVQSELKTKFWGAKIDLSFRGVPTIRFHDGETVEYNKVTTSIHNIIIGKTYVDHHGSMSIRSSLGTTCTLRFCPTGMLTKVPHQVRGGIRPAPTDGGAEARETPVFGTWSASLSCNLHGEGEETLLWERAPPTEEVQRYPNWGYFQARLNERLPCMDPLCPTDSRLRPDQRLAENGEWDDANAEKLRLEDKQRAARKAAKDSGEALRPRWFEEGDDGVYRYVGGYWESKFEGGGDFRGCRDIF